MSYWTADFKSTVYTIPPQGLSRHQKRSLVLDPAIGLAPFSINYTSV